MDYVEQLGVLCRSAQERVLLVAPFIKVAVLESLLGQVTGGVEVLVVTRWWPIEIAHGVSDLGIWNLFRGRDERKLFLRQDVHAKYYRADDQCLAGSVNLTQKALQLVEPSNFEFMINLEASAPEAAKFEEELWRAAVPVDEETYARMREFVASILPPDGHAELVNVEIDRKRSLYNRGDDLATWIPKTRQPGDLFLAYEGRASELSQASAVAAADDLAVINLPHGLDRKLFERAVLIMLLQTPVVAAIDRFVAAERRFGEVAQRVADLTGSMEADRDWQVLLRWLRHFAGDRYCYRRPHHSELIVKNAAAPPT